MIRNLPFEFLIELKKLYSNVLLIIIATPQPNDSPFFFKLIGVSINHLGFLKE